MRSQMISVLSAALVAAAVLVACVDMPGGSGAGGGDPADLPQNAGQWLSYGRDYSEQRFSPLKQVNASNVSQLGLAWYGDLAERGGSYETTPLVVDGRIYRDLALEQGLRLRCQDRQAAVEVRPACPG